MINVIINYINDTVFYSLMSATLAYNTDEINITRAGCNISEGRGYACIDYSNHIEKQKRYTHECKKCHKSSIYEVEDEDQISNNLLQLIYKDCYDDQTQYLNYICKEINPNITFDIKFDEFCENCNKSDSRTAYLEINHCGFTKKVPIYTPNELMILLSFFSIHPSYFDCIKTNHYNTKLISNNYDTLEIFLGLKTRINQPPSLELNYTEYLELSRFIGSTSTSVFFTNYPYEQEK